MAHLGPNPEPGPCPLVEPTHRARCRDPSGSGEACQARDGYLAVEAVFQRATGQKAIDEAIEATLSAVASEVHNVWVTKAAGKRGT